MKKLMSHGLFLAAALILWLGSCGTAPDQDVSQVPSDPAPKSPYFSGDGGKGKSLAVLVPQGNNLADTENYLPTLVQGVLVGDLAKFSAMSVVDRQNLEKLLAETESGIYKDEADFVRLGQVTHVGYALTGALTKTSSGFALQIQVADTSSGATMASYSGACTAEELEKNFTGIRKASLDLLSQLGVELTDQGRGELGGAVRQEAVNAETVLAKGITAQKSGTVVEALSYYIQSVNYDPAQLEAASRLNILSADISSGNMGENVRNDIQWRKQWVDRLTEAEQFYANYMKEPTPYYLIYSTNLQQGKIDYTTGTVDIVISGGLELRPNATWFEPLLGVLSRLKIGLDSTERASEWGLSDWPNVGSTSRNFRLVDRNEDLTVVVELVNENNVTIGRSRLSLWGGWSWVEPSSRTREMTVTPRLDGPQEVKFTGVEANLITDRLTIKIGSIDGVSADIAAKNKRINIVTKEEYAELPEIVAGRDIYDVIIPFSVSLAGELRRRRKLHTSGYYEIPQNLVIPTSVFGIPVVAIGDKPVWGTGVRGALEIASGGFGDSAFADNNLTSITIPGSVTSIGGDAFANNQLTNITIPGSVTSIDGGAFANNQLTSITIPGSVTKIGWQAFGGNPLTKIVIGSNVKLGEPKAGGGVRSFDDGFDEFYNKNGQKAGTYTRGRSNWAYKP